jgi:hypothetical protein
MNSVVALLVACIPASTSESWDRIVESGQGMLDGIKYLYESQFTEVSQDQTVVRLANVVSAPISNIEELRKVVEEFKNFLESLKQAALVLKYGEISVLATHPDGRKILGDLYQTRIGKFYSSEVIYIEF